MSRKIKYITAVMVFGLLTAVYLCFNETKTVFWEIYAYTLKDLLLVSWMLIEFVENKDVILRLVFIGLGSYLMIPFLIRFFCACRSGMDYEAYRVLLNNDNYRLLLTLVLFGVVTIIYTSFKNDTGRN